MANEVDMSRYEVAGESSFNEKGYYYTRDYDDNDRPVIHHNGILYRLIVWPIQEKIHSWVENLDKL